jgi:hypothetical protein
MNSGDNTYIWLAGDWQFGGADSAQWIRPDYV